MKEIQNLISNADNHVKSYSLTKDEEQLQYFYQSIIDTEQKLYQLQEIKDKDSIFVSSLDSISKLITAKFNILDELAQQESGEVAEKALDQFSSNISNQVEEKSWLSKIFKNRKSKKPETIDVDKINAELEKTKSAEAKKEQEEIRKELSLVQQDQEIMLELQGLISIIELNESERLEALSLETERKASITNYFVIIFCLAVVFMLSVAVATVIRFVKHSNEYNAVLKKARKNAVKFAAEKEKFLASISHEIRTPMNAIVGFTDQLAKTELNSTQDKHLRMVRESSTHLLQIVNDLLDFSKIEAGKLSLEKEPTNIDQLKEEVKTMVGGQAKLKGLSFELVSDESMPELIEIDPLRIKQVLINLCINSIKFTPKGTVSLISKVKETGDERLLRIEVSDTGIGMSKEDAKRVFSEYEQAGESSSENLGGTGLGLSITKQLIELHDGRIWAESDLGKGTSMIIELPLIESTEMAQVKDEEVQIEVDFKGKTILIVDDEPFNRELLVTILEPKGCNLLLAENGMEAIEVLQEKACDLVLMDMRMPILDGKEASKNIRESGLAYSTTPIIALSAAGSEKNLNEYRALDLQGYVPKPFKEPVLLKEMQLVLDGKQEIADHQVSKPKVEGIDPKVKYDLSGLILMSNDDPPFVARMLEKFLSNTEAGLAKLEQLLESDVTGEELQIVAHKLYGPATHIKAVDLFPELEQIELKAENEVPAEELKPHLKRAIEAFRTLKPLLRKEISKMMD